jgi:hypothetical protein
MRNRLGFEMRVKMYSSCNDESGCICRACKTNKPRSRLFMIFGSGIVRLPTFSNAGIAGFTMRNVVFHSAERTSNLLARGAASYEGASPTNCDCEA